MMSKMPHSHSKNVLVYLDILFSLFFVGPFTVLYWRGTFVTIYNFFISGIAVSEKWVPSLSLFTVGLVMKILIDFIKHYLKQKICDSHILLQIVVKVIIIYLDALSGVVLWVGGFNVLYSAFPGMRWYQLLTVFLTSSLTLFSIKAFKCTASTPVTIITDSVDNVFTPHSYFSGTVDTRGNYSLVLDTIFSYTIVHSLVICCWWGFWELENHFILKPCEIVIKDFEAWDSVIIAFILSIFIFFINNNVKNYHRRNGSCNTIVIHIISFAAFLASLNFWRGLWSLMDFYFFPSMNVEENLVMSHVVGFIWSTIAGTGLTLTQSSCRDPAKPEYNHCQYWSNRDDVDAATGDDDEESQRDHVATESSPLIVRNL